MVKENVDVMLKLLADTMEKEGLSYFLMLDGGIYVHHNRTGDRKIAEIIEANAEIESKYRDKGPSFEKLYDFIQDLEIDRFGMYDPNPQSSDTPKIFLHIFALRNQVDVCIQKEEGELPQPIAGFFFRNNDINPDIKEFKPMNYSNGFIKFEKDLTFPASTLFDDIEWSDIFGEENSFIKPMLRNILRTGEEETTDENESKTEESDIQGSI